MGSVAQGLVAPWHVESSQLGIKPMFPALAGIFLTSGPPGESFFFFLIFKKMLAVQGLHCSMQASLVAHRMWDLSSLTKD